VTEDAERLSPVKKRGSPDAEVRSREEVKSGPCEEAGAGERPRAADVLVTTPKSTVRSEAIGKKGRGRA